MITSLAVVGALLPAAGAHAAWSAPQTVSAPHTFAGPLVVAPGASAPFAAFAWQDGVRDTARVGASGVGPAGELSLPDGLLDVGRYGRTRVIALAQAGRTLQSIRVRFGSISGGFGAVHTIRTGRVVGPAHLSVAANGRALVGWIESRGSRDIVRVAYRPSGGHFGAPVTLSGRGQASTMAVAIGTGNDMAVVAERNGTVIARTRPRGGSWRPIERLTTARGQTQWRFAAAVDATGHTQLAWRRSQKRTPKTPSQRSLETAPGVRGRPLGSVQTLAIDGVLGAPALLDSPEGFAVGYARLEDDTGSSAMATVHVRRPGQRFGPRLLASPPTGGLRDVSLAADAGSGTLAAAWVVPTPSGDGGGLAQAAVRPFLGAFGPVEQVTPDEAVTEVELAPAPGDGSYEAFWVARPEGTGPSVPLAEIRTVVRRAVRTP